MTRAILILFLAQTWLSAQPIPKFEDYPAGPIYRGKPALPKLVTSGQRMFRTMIRNGAVEGPAFAGHIAVAQWGCGSGCRSMALIDSIDGTVHAAPFSILGDGIAIATFEGGEEEPMISFRLNSRLLIVRGCPEDTNCASYFYEWTGRALKLIRKIPATIKKK
jgi:hypothetical protein